MKILVADDNHVNQRVASLTLKKLGYACEVAGNGLEAVAAWQTGTYDAILMDCQMPEMDGFEATIEIRQRETDGRRIPIIAMTASDIKDDRNRCLAVGMDGYVSKPVRPADLAHVLETSIAAHAAPARADALDGGTVAALRQLAEPGGADPFPEIARCFLDHAASRIDSMSQDGGDDVLAAQAHSLRGMSGTIGARRLARLCAELEESVSVADPDRISRLKESIHQEFQRVRHAVEIALLHPAESVSSAQP